ncbi:hypothetical protein AB0D99_32030 [Streptomyces sp. NPDC047971]|uniref:hypothetical protein n=1 Tax=Streptomyces sp. NPDC047971 TaxID=3154499 RepID=UPI0033F0688A
MNQPSTAEHCGRTRPHPTHKVMVGRKVFQCPGTANTPECVLDSCTQACTTECREVINRAWHSLRGATPTEQPVRYTVDTITSDALDQLYAERDANERRAEAYGQAWQTTEQRAKQAEAELAALKRAHVALAGQAGKDQAAIERVRKVLAERRAEIADYEAENEPAAWSDAAANTCSRIEDALVDHPKPRGIRNALDEHQEQT